MVVGFFGTVAVALGIAALRLVLRPRHPGALPPSAEVYLSNDRRIESLFRDLWRFVALTGAGAGAQFAALVWQLGQS